MDILAVMAVCKQKGMTQNQQYIATTWLGASDSGVYRFAFGSDCRQAEADTVYISASDGKWENFVSFVQVCLQKS